MTSSILLIIPYFGKFKNYFQLFLESCRVNSSINWLILTDDVRKFDYPKNVSVVYMTFDELKARFENKLNMPISLKNPYKLCDFKPTYGVVFDDYIKEFDFWGYCDTDLIFGNIRRFLTEDILQRCDKVLTRGHLSLWRNCRRMNEFFKEETDEFYKIVFSSDDQYAFDEYGSYGIAHRLKEKLEPERFYDEIPYDDLYILKGSFVSSQRGARNMKNAVYCFSDGELVRYFIDDRGELGKEYVLYVHMQKRDMVFKDVSFDSREFIITPPIDLRN